MAAAMKKKRDDGVILLRDGDVAKALGMSVATIRRWRVIGRGPVWVKLEGGAVRYERGAFEAWLAAQKRSDGGADA